MSRLLIFAALLVAFLRAAAGQNGALLVRTDLDCKWSVDGQPQGVLNSGDEKRLSLSAGEHKLEATPVAGGPRWQESVKVGGTDGQVVAILLKDAVTRAGVQTRGYWVDPETKFTWAAADNGSGVTWSQAVYYCRSLTLGGFNDWTLAAIDDLHGLFGGPANQSGFHVRAPLKLTGWAWSSSEGKESGERWALDFGDGARASVVSGDSGLNRALCARQNGAN